MKWEEAPLVDSPKWANAPLVGEPKWAKAPVVEEKQGNIIDAVAKGAGLHGVMIGAAETGLQLASGLAGQAVGGIRALASPLTGEDPRQAIESTAEKLTYQPRTRVGKAFSQAAGVPLEYIEKGLNFVGEKTADVTGSPAIGAAVKAGLSVAPIPFLKGKAKAVEKPIWETPKSEIVDPVAHEIAVRIAADEGKPIPPEVLKDYPDVKLKGQSESVADVEVYHGSPHDFEKFNITKIGTGEGAQAFGHGLYFSENKKVAEFYQKEQAGENSGGLYKVKIPQHVIDNMIDWDKPVSQQSNFVLDALGINKHGMLLGKGKDIHEEFLYGLFSDRRKLAGFPATKIGVANYFKSKGITGISYLDEGSRGKGEGTRNFVLFDDKNIRIVEKDGKPVVDILEETKAPPKTVGDFHEPLFKPEVSPQITKGISEIAKEFFAKNPEQRNPALLISDDIVRQGLAGKIPEELLQKHNLNPQEFQVIWRKTVTSAAQTLARLSQIERRLKLTPEEADVLRNKGLDVDDATIIQPLWKRLDNIRRGLLVTQFATAARNATTQAGRLSLDVLQAPIDASIQALAGKKPTASPFDGMDQFVQLFKKNKDAVDQILANQPRARERMFATYMSDVAAADKSTKGKVLSGVEKAVDILNWANKGQELIIRRAVFQSNLSQTMRRNGLDLEKMIKNKEFESIPQEYIESAVSKSLEVTFSETPKYGTASRAFVDLINKVPGATFVIPFPRFLMNATKFLWDYNPTGFLNYLSTKERAAFAAGDTSKMSKAIIGSGLLATALYFRNSEYAGEKWYEAKTPEGKIIDLRPFNPFAAYIFLADVAKRSHEGTLHRLTAKDITMGVLSTQLRAGTGLYLLDESLKSLASDANNEEKWKRRAKEFAGEVVGGMLTPLAQLRDLYAEFDEESRKLRDTRQEPFLGPIKRQIPGLSKTLPEAEIPTRAGPIEQIHPGVRQLTGISVTGPKNPIEKELDRLGFERYEILRSTGDPVLDRKQAEAMGPLVEKIGNRIVNNPSYQKMTDAQKAVLLNEVVGKIRAAARGSAKSALPAEEHLKEKIENQPPRTRRLLNEIGIQ